MKLSSLKAALIGLEDLDFLLPNGEKIPSHFHITEVGQAIKHFVDCGGTVREERLVNFQLWHTNDFDHRLNAQKTLQIIAVAENKLGLQDAEIEVEYQSDTIGKYGLDVVNGQLQLITKTTDCLAREGCVIPVSKKEIDLSNLVVQNTACTPVGGCC
ncbi:MAG: DUF6428 family protein [Bacteroidota bacterium]